MVSNIKKNCIQCVKIFFLIIKKKCSKNEVVKLASWQHFLISGKHRAYPFSIFVLCSSQIKNYIITGLVSNFLIHLVRGWHFLCRKENTNSLTAATLNNKFLRNFFMAILFILRVYVRNMLREIEEIFSYFHFSCLT